MNAAVSITGRAPSVLVRWRRRSLTLALTLACCCGPKAGTAVQTPPIAVSPPETVEDAGSAPEPDPPPAAEDAELPAAGTPEEVAQRWLEALRRESPALLGEWSRYPFMLHDTGAEGTCGHGAAADATQLIRLLSCLLTNRPLLYELRANPLVPATPLKAKDLPAWARRWRNELNDQITPVLLEIPGRSSASHFVLLVFEGGVSALWKETVFE